jgi:hypothetical protein
MAVSNFSNWFLPSKGDLEEIYNVIHLESLGSFIDAEYWTSTEYTYDLAYTLDFTDGSIVTPLKSESNYVRACRKFTALVAEYAVGDIGPGSGYIYYVDGTTYYEVSSTEIATTNWANVTDVELGDDTQGEEIGDGLTNTAFMVDYLNFLITGYNNGDESSYLSSYEIEITGDLTNTDLFLVPRQLDVGDDIREKVGASENLLSLGGYRNTTFYGSYSLDYQYKDIGLWFNETLYYGSAYIIASDGTLSMPEGIKDYMYTNINGISKYQSLITANELEDDEAGVPTSIVPFFNTDTNETEFDIKDAVTEPVEGAYHLAYTKGICTRKINTGDFLIYSYKVKPTIISPGYTSVIGTVSTND